MIEIAPGIHQLSLWDPLLANVFLVEDGAQLVLVDAGMRWDSAKILRAAGRLGWPGRPLRAIAITHADVDHLGAVPQLVEATGARVIAHRAEVPLAAARGWRPLAGPRLMARLVAPLSGPVMRAMLPRVPVTVDRPVEDGDEIPGGFRVVHTPGHTPGHIALYHPTKRVLLTGDALGNLRRLNRPTMAYTPDKPGADDSIRRLATLDVEVAGFGHGPPIRHAAGTRIREFARTLG